MRFPPKVVPLETVFIVILWKCSKNPQRLARKCQPSQVEGWLAYAANARNLRDPVGLVVARLRDGEPAPEPDGGGDGRDRRTSKRDRERYEQWGKTKTCPVCSLVRPIEHVCPECGRCFDCCQCEIEETEEIVE